MRIPSGTTDQYIYFVAVDSTDLKSRETGLSSFTVYRSRNGGTAAAFTTPTINETDTTNMPGVYELLLDEDMTIDAGDDSQEMCVHITHAGMHPVTRVFELYRPKATVGNTLDVTTTGAAGIDWGNVENPSTSNTLSATTISTSQNITNVTGTVGSVTGSVGSVTGAVGSVTGAVGSVTTVSAGAITAGSFGVGAIDASAIAADAIGSSELATTAVNEIRDAILSDSTAFAGANIDAAISTRATPAQVNAEVLDVLNVDTFAEPGQATPAATATLASKINYLYKAWRNKKTQTSTQFSLYADDTTTVDQKATTSDDGSTTTVGEIATGP